MRNKYFIIIILSLSVLTHFIFFGHPDETVFDEVHFGKFISGYYTHEYFFDIHPPLGKLVIAGFAGLFGYQPEFAFADIGDVFPNKQYLLLRFLPSLAGALLPVVIFLLLLQLNIRPWLAFFGGLLIILENAVLTQSLYILMDPFLLLFGFTSLLFYFKYLNWKLEIGNWKFLLAAGIFGALAASIKWTGLAFLATPAVVEGVKYIYHNDFSKLSRLIFYLAIIPLIIYFTFFAIHFSLLYKSGPGDAFMSENFRRTLQGSEFENTEGPESGLIFKFTALNMEMYRSNQRLQNTHPYSSAWYTWPTMTRPIYYWVNGHQRIYFIGNPVIWWASTIVILIALIKMWSDRQWRSDHHMQILFGAYFINILPFIGVKRVMFLYHYMPALIFAIVMMIYLINKMKDPRKVVIPLLAASIVAFIYFAPLNYGLDLKPNEYEQRVWFGSWK